MNTHSLRWVAERDGVPVMISERRESGDWEAQRDGIEQADLILAAETGAPGVRQWLPSAGRHVQACDYLRRHPQRFAEIATFRPSAGGRYFLFRRIAAAP